MYMTPMAVYIGCGHRLGEGQCDGDITMEDEQGMHSDTKYLNQHYLLLNTL